jgi:hypothetical protein
MAGSQDVFRQDPPQGLKDRNPLGAQTGYLSKNMMESFFYKNHIRKEP